MKWPRIQKSRVNLHQKVFVRSSPGLTKFISFKTIAKLWVLISIVETRERERERERERGKERERERDKGVIANMDFKRIRNAPVCKSSIFAIFIFFSNEMNFLNENLRIIFFIPPALISNCEKRGRDCCYEQQSNREEEEGRETRTKVKEKEKGKGIVRMFWNIRVRYSKRKKERKKETGIEEMYK
jgi:hypothetical protein